MAAIEPLGSVMSFQAQPAVQNVTPSNSQVAMEGQTVDSEAPRVDEKTLSVRKLQNDAQEDAENEEQQESGFDAEMMAQAMKELNKKASNVEAEFGIHEKTNRITIKMVDKQTKEVIKELPPEKMLDMVARIWEMSGLVVDEKR